MPYFPVLDAVRFVAAFVVVLHHARPPALGLDGAYSVAFFGRAAVVVFFVVSGFCIHAPNVSGGAVDWRGYFVRRYVRLLVPLACIVPIANANGVSYHPYDGWITWSLVCELVYYTAYPLLLKAWTRVGWGGLFAIGIPVAYASVWWCRLDPGPMVNRAAEDILSNLPTWLAGCLLADLVVRRKKTPALGVRGLAAARVAVYAGAVASAALHYRHIVVLDWTLPAFGLLSAAWVWAELSRPRTRGLGSWLGSWSYSLYLVHVPVFWGIWTYPCGLSIVSTVRSALQPHDNARFVIAVTAALIASYLFFLVVEKPSHQLARRLAAVVAGRRAPAPALTFAGGPPGAA